MTEIELEQVEKIVQHAVKSVTHTTAPETREILRSLHSEFLHLIEDQNKVLAEIKEDGKETKAQAKLTNGRVGALENWRWFISGGLAIITIIILPLLFIFIK